MLDLTSTLGLRAAAPRGAAREQALSGFLPWLCFAREDVILLRDGDVMGAFLVDGLDPLTAEQAAIADLSEAMSRCAAELPPDAALYVHRLSHPETPEVPVIPGTGFAAELDIAWRAHLRSLGLRRRRVMVSVLLRPAKAAGLRARLTGGGAPAQREALAKRIARLDEIMADISVIRSGFTEASTASSSLSSSGSAPSVWAVARFHLMKPARSSGVASKWRSTAMETTRSPSASLMPRTPVDSRPLNTRTSGTGKRIALPSAVSRNTS